MARGVQQIDLQWTQAVECTTNNVSNGVVCSARLSRGYVSQRFKCDTTANQTKQNNTFMTSIGPDSQGER